MRVREGGEGTLHVLGSPGAGGRASVLRVGPLLDFLVRDRRLSLLGWRLKKSPESHDSGDENVQAVIAIGYCSRIV